MKKIRLREIMKYRQTERKKTRNCPIILHVRSDFEKLNIPMILTDNRKYHLLLEISQKVRDTLDLDEILENFLDIVKTVVDYDAAGIFALNQELVHRRHEQPRGMIAGITRRGYDVKPADDDAMLRDGKGIVGYVIFTGESLIVPDVRRDNRYIEGRRKTRSEIAVPIKRNNRAIGALNLESDRSGAYDQSDLEVLHFFADAAAISIEKAMLHRQLLEKEMVDQQLKLARDAQSRLFPEKSPSIQGYDIAGICLPAEEIGGDYYDYLRLPHREWGMVVADVSGHGIAAALMMTAFRGLLRVHTRGKLDLNKMAGILNHQLPEFSGNNDFVTAVYLVLNPVTNEVTYICCGQQPPLLLHVDGKVALPGAHGPALGVLDEAQFPVEKRLLSPGDVLAIYTDGVVEIANPDGEDYGNNRLAAVLRAGRELPAEALVQKVIADTQNFSGFQNYQDDFTIVIIKRMEEM